MGCCLSNSNRQDYDEKMLEIDSLQKKICEQRLNIETSVTEFNEIPVTAVDIDSVAKKLKTCASRLKKLAKEVKKIKQCRTDDTIKPFTSTEELKNIQRISYEVSPDISPESKKERRKQKKVHTPGLPTPESILNDPEIFALIQKNRNILLRKLTT